MRLRIDGVLHEVQRIPKRMMPGVTTRLKVLAKLDIAERRKPQDGRISLNAAAAGRMLDVRVATLPTVEGEAVVMRLLDKSKKAPTLTELAQICNMSVRQLTRGFRASRGCSIGDYITQSRIYTAKRLLASDESIKAIARSMGFASPSSFSYAFRRGAGVTPRQFRMSARNG